MSILRKFKHFMFSEDGSLKDRAIRSGFWLGLTGIIVQFLSIFRSIVLARLLTPEVFGLMGICMILTRGVEILTQPGFAAALIYRKRHFEEAKYTAFTILSIRGILLAILIVAISPWISRFYEDEIIRDMLMLMSVNFVFTGFSNINIVLHQKELNFRRLSYLEQTVTILSTAIVIAFAYYMRSAWALVIGFIATGVFQALFSYILIPGKIKFKWDREIAKELFSYGKYVTGTGIVLYFVTEIDSALVGKFVGIKELGYYVLAFTTANMVTTYISKMLSRIMFPAYSKLQNNPAALRTAYLNVFSMVVAITFPIATSIMVFAPQLMVIVYGEQWLPAAQPLVVLCVFGIIRSVASLTGFFLNGVGKPEIGFRNSLARLIILLIILYPLIMNYGLLGAAVAVTFAIGVQLLLGIRGVMSIIDLRVVDILRHIYPQLLKMSLVLVIFFVGEIFLDTYKLINIFMLITLGAIIYLALSYKYLSTLFRGRREVDR